MCTERTQSSEAALLQLYGTTCAEITRYRDREWHNQGIFTAAIVAIIGFILADRNRVQDIAHLFDVSLILLTLGNIFYTAFAHHRLTEQRNILVRLQRLLHYHNVIVESKPLLPPKWKKEPKTFTTGWTRGFWSHLAPFWVFNLWLVYEGIRLIHTP